MNTGFSSVALQNLERQRMEILYRIQRGECTTMERYGYDWVKYLLQSKRAHYMSESSIFGTVTFYVPYAAADAVEAIMWKFGIPLLKKVNIRSCQTHRILDVELTYKTNEVGIINV